MHLITIAWSMIAAAALTIGVIHLIIWAKQRAQIAYLAFAVIAFSVTCIAGVELSLMHAWTAHEFGEALRWTHVPIFIGIVGLVWFVHVFLGAGRLWLAWTVCAIRFASLIVNFYADVNVNYTEITGLHQVEIWGGERIVVAEGLINPWMRFAQLSLLLLVVYVVDAVLAVWRRGGRDERRRAVVVGGSITAFVLVAGVHWALVVQGIIVSPFIIAPTFLLVVIAMSYELSLDVMRAEQLGRRLQISDVNLRNSEQRMELAVRAARISLWVWDVTRDTVWVTPRSHHQGVANAEHPFELEHFLQSVHPADRENLRGAAQNAFEKGVELNVEYRVTGRDGQPHWIAARGRVEEAISRRLAGVAIDISARKHAELQVEQDRIALRNMSRVAILGQLSASIAHQLNQPLAAILGNAEAARQMLEREPIDLVELRQICDDIVNEDQRAAEVIRRLRGLFRHGETKREPLDLNALVHETLDLVSNELLTRHVTAGTDLAPVLPPVGADRVQLQQVLMNLILNAADAMNGQVEGRVVTIRTEAAGAGVRLSVVDQGPGIAAADLQKIFDAFWSTKHGGMGMGLAICKTILDAHGGSIAAVNNAGGGATFCVTLPSQERA